MNEQVFIAFNNFYGKPFLSERGPKETCAVTVDSGENGSGFLALELANFMAPRKQEE